jgi:hypothetical protein
MISTKKVWNEICKTFFNIPQHKKANRRYFGIQSFPDIRKTVAAYEVSHALPVCLSGKSYIKMMGTENRWKDTDRAKRTYVKKPLSHCQIVHHKSHTNWSGSNSCIRIDRPAYHPQPGYGLCSTKFI